MSTAAAIASQLSSILEETATLCVEVAESLKDEKLGQKLSQKLAEITRLEESLMPLVQAQHPSHP